MDSTRRSSLHAALILLPIVLLFVAFPLHAQVPDKSKRQPQGARTNLLGTPLFQIMNINNITLWGDAAAGAGMSPRGDNQGIFPRGMANILFEDRMLWGGKVFVNANKTTPATTQPIRVGGGAYTVGTKVGRIIGFGSTAVAADPNGAEAKIYRIRRDYAQMSVEELRRDAAEMNEIPLSEVTPAQIEAIRIQFAADWSQWPVQYGAPFIERNNVLGYQAPPAFSSAFTVDSLISGRYDEPGIAGANPDAPADQVMWTVFNDLDRTQCLSFSESEPIGLELQMTIWGYKRTDQLGNVIFRRLKIINKGGVDTSNTSTPSKGAFWVDSMYVAQFSDGDLGNASDDLHGCDSVLSIGYYYNGIGYDGSSSDKTYRTFNLPPPALGYDILGGPRIPSVGEFAIFDLKRIEGWKNLPMTSFMPWASGDPYSEPPTGQPRSYSTVAGLWWKILKGYVPIGNFTSRDELWPSGPFPPSKFPHSGDPISGTGWIDGIGAQYSFYPGDQRITLASGPFSLAPGDTQEVVVALVAGMGADRLSSIAAMRTVDYAAQSLHDASYSIVSRPAFSVSVSYPTSTQASLKITADSRASLASYISVTLKRHDGTSIVTAQLSDDGLHGDVLPNDGVFANTVTINREQTGSFLDAVVVDGKGTTTAFARVEDPITTSGTVDVLEPIVFSDNLNNDGKVNTGENVRYGFSVTNNTLFEIKNLRIAVAGDYLPGKTNTVRQLSAGQVFTFSYNESADSTYFSINLPATYTDTLYRVAVALFDQQSNRWAATINFPVVQLKGPVTHSMLAHVKGIADGSFVIRIVDPQAVKNHLYVIRGVDSVDQEGTPGFMLKDSTDGRILLANSPLPDSLGHNVPVTDGFKVFQGTINEAFVQGMKDWSVSAGARRWSWVHANDYNLEGFNGAMASGFGWQKLFFLEQTVLKRSSLKNVLIKFAATDTSGKVLTADDPNLSYAYRYLRNASLAPAKPEFAPFIKNPTTGYPYQDYLQSVPFSAWDVEANPPRRLMVGHFENNVANGRVDGKYWPPVVSESINNAVTTGPREWFFIFDAAYAQTPDSRMMTDLLNKPTPLMWFGAPTRTSNEGFQSGDQFLIVANHVITSNDAWTFNPTIVTDVEDQPVPFIYSLANNYPNPFNPSTKIEFSLPRLTEVSLKIYNILGQEIVTLVQSKLDMGKHLYEWDGKNNLGVGVATGVYLYRLAAGDFVQTRKMILLR